jgi:acyl carrier protein
LRLDSPLLSREQWPELLRAAGFADVQAYPEARSPAEVLGAHIFVVRMPAGQGAQQLAGADVFKGDFAARSLRPAQSGVNGAALAAQAREFLQSLREAAEAERCDMLIEYVRGHVAKVLRREESDPIERRQRLMDLGIDSLMAVQLRNLLGAGLGLKQPLPATLIFNYPTVEVIAAYLEKQIFGAAENSQAAPEKNGQEEITAATLALLSDDQVADLLLEKLERR